MMTWTSASARMRKQLAARTYDLIRYDYSSLRRTRKWRVELETFYQRSSPEELLDADADSRLSERMTETLQGISEAVAGNRMPELVMEALRGIVTNFLFYFFML